MRKNLTLSIEEEILHQARIEAAKQHKTVTGIVREFLTGFSRKERDRKASIRRLKKLMDTSTLDVGPITWKRDDLYER